MIKFLLIVSGLRTFCVNMTKYKYQWENIDIWIYLEVIKKLYRALIYLK